MRERESPERWPAAKRSEQGNQKRIPIPPLIPGSSATSPVVATSVGPQTSSVPAIASSSGSRLAEEDNLEGGQPVKSTAISKLLSSVPLEVPPQLQSWSKSWLFWACLATVMAGGVGITAMALLFKLPTVPNCPSMFWPTASASMRLYCAQLAAKKQTVKDLLEAIALVKSLPPDHPLREDVNEQIKQWSMDILDLAETSFDAGQIDEAIATAKKIPADLPAYSLVQKRIERWKSLWSNADSIYKEAEKQVRLLNWSQAFREAVRLLYIRNTYWSTTKYEQLNQLIVSARDDGDILAKGRNLAKKGTLKNWVEAIKVLDAIKPNSFLYQEAQKSMVEIGQKMLALAQARLEDQDVDAALTIARQIPERANLQAQVQDLTNLVEAQSIANQGTSASLEQAIAMAKKLSPDRPLYSKGQDLIIRWQQEMGDIVHLEKARQLAQLGTANDLKSAIKEAQLIPARNPRGKAAKAEISRWMGQIQTMEDRPYLSRAEQMASLGDQTSLQAAIDEAKQIKPGRALSGEAQTKIGQWTAQIERIQDQPYLDQARQLASSGNLIDAITTAGQIRPGRALSREAQGSIRDWQIQIRAQQNLDEGRRIATSGTPDALASAIRTVNRVPNSSSLRSEAEDAINQWSYQLLSQAQDRATYDLPAAIAIAKSIPSGSSVYSEAKAQIEVWQNILNPPPIPSPEPVVPESAPAPAPPSASTAPAPASPSAPPPISEQTITIPQNSPTPVESNPPTTTVENDLN